MLPLEAVLWSTQMQWEYSSNSLSLYICLSLSLGFREPICPIVGSKEALCRANEIKAHLGKGINQTDRFNGP